MSLNDSFIESNYFVARIKNGNSIEYNFLSELLPHDKQLKILHQAFPSVIFQRKNLALHGSAFSFNGKTIILLGDSGSGKSETINLISKVHKIITDDIVSVDIKSDNLFCNNGIPILCVKDGEIDALPNDIRQRSIKVLDQKSLCMEKTKITDIFFLEWGQEDSIKGIKKIEAFKKIIPNTFRPLPEKACKDSDKFFIAALTKLLSETDQSVFFRKNGSINESVSYLLKYLKLKY